MSNYTFVLDLRTESAEFFVSQSSTLSLVKGFTYFLSDTKHKSPQIKLTWFKDDDGRKLPFKNITS